MKKSLIFVALVLPLSGFYGCGGCGRAGDGIGWTDSSDVVSARVPVRDTFMLTRELTYDNYTLADTFRYRDTERHFQWDKIEKGLRQIDSLNSLDVIWGVLQNKSNVNGRAPLTSPYLVNKWNNPTDTFGVERYQSIPLYPERDLSRPTRYARDGSLIRLWTDAAGARDTLLAEVFPIGGYWRIPGNYIKTLGDTTFFADVIVADRNFQYIAYIQKDGRVWKVRAMNPATTGAARPPHHKPTPLGIFVLQDKREKMVYLVDGTTDYEGFAPWANRFCCGGYIHGIPIVDPTISTPVERYPEFSASLGTTPRSHMCVRVATSLAKYIYDNAPENESLIMVIE